MNINPAKYPKRGFTDKKKLWISKDKRPFSGKTEVSNQDTDIEVYFDGACIPFNPGGIASFGYVICQGGKVIKEGYGLACEPFSRQATNNYAEYMGLIKALEVCKQEGYERIFVKGDSQLVIKQMEGIYSVKAENLLEPFKKAQELAGEFKDIVFIWIPRERNSKADELSTKEAWKYLTQNIDKIRIPFGKFKGQTFKWLAENKRDYLKWLYQQEGVQEGLKKCIRVALRLVEQNGGGGGNRTLVRRPSA